MKELSLFVNETCEDERIDRFLAAETEGLSRSYIQKLILDGNLSVNGKSVKSNYKVKSEDKISLYVPDSIVPEIKAENIPLDIVYEDGDVLVVNKPKGMVVHPAAGHYSGTLVNALMYHCSDLSGINGVLRPGIVHRIDKDTSGLLLVAKNDFAHSSLAEQLKNHTVTRRYQAICVGNFKETEGKIDAPIGRSTNDRKLMSVNVRTGKPAVTHYSVLKQMSKNAHVECVLETGRTHQIRVHMKSINHPLLGDVIYGGKLSEFKLSGNPLEGQTLHAKVIGFIHPRTGEYLEFDSELPDYFKKLLEIL